MTGSGHRLAHKYPVRMADLRGEQVIIFNRHPGIIAQCRKAKVEPGIFLDLSEYRLAEELARAEKAVFFWGDSPVKFNGLAVVNVEDFNCSMDVRFVRNKKLKKTEASQRFIEYTLGRKF
jgi:hypothetical protein